MKNQSKAKLHRLCGATFIEQYQGEAIATYNCTERGEHWEHRHKGTLEGHKGKKAIIIVSWPKDQRRKK